MIQMEANQAIIQQFLEAERRKRSLGHGYWWKRDIHSRGRGISRLRLWGNKKKQPLGARFPALMGEEDFNGEENRLMEDF